MAILALPPDDEWNSLLFVPMILTTDQTAFPLPSCPEKRLMLAVLEQAIEDWRKYRHTTKYSTPWYMAKRASEWLWDDDMNWPYSFCRICAATGLEPEAVRLALA